MKQINYKQLRAYKNLPRYDVGASSISSGYQRNYNLSLAGYYGQAATPITNSFVPQAITQGIGDLTNTAMMLYQSGMFNKSKNSTTPVGSTTQPAAAPAPETAAPTPTPTAAVSPQSTTDTQSGLGNVTTIDQLSIYGLPLVNDEVNDGYIGESIVTAKAPQSSVAEPAQQSVQTGGNAAKATGGKAAKAAGKALGIMQGAIGTLDMLNTLTDTSTLGTSDLQSMSSKLTNYINGVGYETYGGYDKAGADKYVKDLNKAATIGGITKGMSAGASLGSLCGPIGSAIGAGVGALVGGIGSIFGNRKRKKKMQEAQRKWNIASDAYNNQSESEAASQALLNEYYATHADKGLSVNTKNPNALVQGGEPIVTVNGKGKVVSADMFPITKYTPERVDNIPVKLDLGNSKQGVIGNKIDPFTGQRLAVEGRQAVAALNDPSVKNKQPYKDLLKYLLDLQEVLPDNRDMKNKKIAKYHFGKCLPMLDAGWAYSAIPTVLNMANGIMGLLAAKKEPISVRDSYTPNYQTQLAAALMPTTVNIDPELDAANQATRQGQYAIGQSGGLSGGQRMSMLNQLYNDRMANMANIHSTKTDRENQLKTNVANFLYQSGEAEATRRQAAKQKYNEDLRQAVAAKQQLVDTSRKNIMNAINSGFENLFNWHMFKRNTDLWQQELDQDQQDYLNGKKAEEAPVKIKNAKKTKKGTSTKVATSLNPKTNWAAQKKQIYNPKVTTQYNPITPQESMVTLVGNPYYPWG